MDRRLTEIMGAVLHELRRSGPLGLHGDELLERIADPLVSSAIGTLSEEGRVVARDGLLVLSAAQREVESLRAEIANAPPHTAARIAELEEAEAALGRWQKTALAAKDRSHAALGKRLYRLYEAVLALAVEPGSLGNSGAFALAIHAASWIASYGGDEAPALDVVRLSVGASTIRVAVLGAHEGGWMLCSPATWMLGVNALGRAPGSECHIIADDLARLRGEKAEG